MSLQTLYLFLRVCKLYNLQMLKFLFYFIGSSVQDHLNSLLDDWFVWQKTIRFNPNEMERKINQITVCPDKEGLKSCWFLNQEASDFAADRRAMRGSTKQLSSRGRDKGVSKKCLEGKKMRSMPESFDLFCFYHL